MKDQKFPAYYIFLGAVVAWFAVILQFYITINNRVLPLPAAIIKFFSYFTILTNISVALCFTILFIAPKSALGKWLSKNTTLTAITVYILVVGAVYNLVLRSTNHPVGFGILADELLHSVIPVMFLGFWFWKVPKSGLKYNQAYLWLGYPLLYIIYILIRGSIVHQYPYFFLNVDSFGYTAVMINCLGLFFVFLSLFFLFIWMAKLIAKSKSN